MYSKVNDSTNWRAISNLINDCFLYLNKDDDNPVSCIVFDYLDRLNFIVNNEVDGLTAIG